jgi:hypothetical protein
MTERAIVKKECSTTIITDLYLWRFDIWENDTQQSDAKQDNNHKKDIRHYENKENDI